MGQYADISRLVGKEIIYRDSYSGNRTTFTITSIVFDEYRHGYSIRGDGIGDFIFLTTQRALTLAIPKRLTHRSKIYRCSHEETYKIQG